MAGAARLPVGLKQTGRQTPLPVAPLRPSSPLGDRELASTAKLTLFSDVGGLSPQAPPA